VSKLKINNIKNYKNISKNFLSKVLLEMIEINLKDGNISMLLDSIKIVGDTYLMFGEIKNAINTFNNMVNL
jgi:hypothetical protein